jgi:hypothetical protein
METNWLKEALYGGMTSNALKLGTVLSLGWFWPRVGGCSVLYRGEGMETIDFASILAVAEAGADQIGPPSYVQHNSSSAYFYVIRRANNCGGQEHTLSAAVKVSIDAEGNLAGPQPNRIFSARAKQVDGSKLELVWYYCPLEQQTPPVCFNVYYDGGAGQIDYETPVATFGYAGRRFYSYESDLLDPGEYLFCIRAEDAAGTESSSSAHTRIQLDAASPKAIEILSAEPV